MNKRIMQEAIDLAKEKLEQNEGGPFAALIMKDNKIIGRGWNQVTSRNDPTAHAEIVAIRDACKRLDTFSLKDCEIYVNCEPCPMCLAAIYWARIKRIYYAASRKDAAAIGFDDDFIYEQIKKSPQNRSIEMIQNLREEALELFKQWMRKENRKEY